MIPDFKTYIGESVWADIHKRSNGISVRKENYFDDIYDYITSKYEVCYVNMDEIEYKDDYIHIPIYKILGLNTYSSVDIHKDSISFSSIDPDRYKSYPLKKFITPIKDDISLLYDKIKDVYSPKIFTFDGVDHWIEFKITPKDGKMTSKFCEEVIDFILSNTTDNNKKILKILEKK